MSDFPFANILLDEHLIALDVAVSDANPTILVARIVQSLNGYFGGEGGRGLRADGVYAAGGYSPTSA